MTLAYNVRARNEVDTLLQREVPMHRFSSRHARPPGAVIEVISQMRTGLPGKSRGIQLGALLRTAVLFSLNTGGAGCVLWGYGERAYSQ